MDQMFRFCVPDFVIFKYLEDIVDAGAATCAVFVSHSFVYKA